MDVKEIDESNPEHVIWMLKEILRMLKEKNALKWAKARLLSKKSLKIVHGTFIQGK